MTANILREKSSGGNSVTLNAGSSVLNKKNGFTVWKGSSDCSDFLSVVLETVSNCATPGKVTLVENAIVNKKEIKKSNYSLIFSLQLLEMSLFIIYSKKGF